MPTTIFRDLLASLKQLLPNLILLTNILTLNYGNIISRMKGSSIRGQDYESQATIVYQGAEISLVRKCRCSRFSIILNAADLAFFLISKTVLGS